MSAGLLTLLCLTLGPAAGPADVWTLRDRHLQIPIRVNEARRNDLVELVLYVSTDQGRTWTGAGKAKPSDEAFNFHAPNDGLYWFNVQAVDRDGKYDPPDIAQAPPALKVLIDTQKPLVQISSAERVGDEVLIAWQTVDPQADVNSMKLEYRPSDGSSPFWQTAPATPALAGQTRFRPTTTGPITVRIQMLDATGTPVSVTRELPAASPAMQQSNSVAPPPPSIPTGPATSALPTGLGSGAPAMEPPQPVAAPPVAPPATPLAAPVAPAVPTPTVAESPTSSSGLAPLAGLRPGEELRKPQPAPAEFGQPAGPPSRSALADIQHVRDKQIGLDFEIERRGPSGIKKIETYITADEGQTWYKWSESPETAPPLIVSLPEKEGVYGFRLVVYSGVMQSEGPPKSGMAPEVRVQVDRTPPQVEWYPPAIDPALPNALTLRFSASDSNLDPGSIVLQWSRQPDAGWQTIPLSNLRASAAPGVPHLKECTWLLPADVPDAVFLRLTARDLAGNVGERITRDPVTVDLHKPTARVKRIVPASTVTSFRP